jgi:hypothetical protein
MGGALRGACAGACAAIATSGLAGPLGASGLNARAVRAEVREFYAFHNQYRPHRIIQIRLEGTVVGLIVRARWGQAQLQRAANAYGSDLCANFARMLFFNVIRDHGPGLGQFICP